MFFVGEDVLVLGGVNLNDVLGLLPSCALSGLSGLF